MQQSDLDPAASEDWAKLQGLLRSLPPIPTYSQAKQIAIGLLGPKVRIWRNSNVVSIGYDRDNQRFILGEAKDYTNALKLVMLTLANAKAKRNQNDKEGIGWISSEVGVGNEESKQGPFEGSSGQTPTAS